jgi:hypothetical protein
VATGAKFIIKPLNNRNYSVARHKYQVSGLALKLNWLHCLNKVLILKYVTEIQTR